MGNVRGYTGGTDGAVPAVRKEGPGGRRGRPARRECQARGAMDNVGQHDSPQPTGASACGSNRSRVEAAYRSGIRGYPSWRRRAHSYKGVRKEVSIMFGRIGIFSGPAGRVDDDVTRQAREQTLRILQSIPGFAG